VADTIKRALPNAEVTWLVEPAALDLVANNPAIDRALVFPAKRWLKQAKGVVSLPAIGGEAGKFFSQLRAEHFDAAIDAQGLFKSGMLALASGAPVRVGFAGTREFAERFLTHPLDVGDYFGHDVPVVELNNRLAEYLLDVLGIARPPSKITFSLPLVPEQSVAKVNSLLVSAATGDAAPGVGAIPPMAPAATGDAAPGVGAIPPTAPAAARDAAPGVGAIPPTAPAAAGDAAPGVGAIPPTAPLPEKCMVSPATPENPRQVVLIPGTTWSTKIWPTNKWIELAIQLIDRFGSRLILVGGPSERNTNREIVSQITKSRPAAEILNLTEQTSFLDLIALFRQVDLVIGADTGPVHLSAATGKPAVVGVYGSKPIKRLGPYGPQCRTVALNLWCQPCYSKVCPLGTIDCLNKLEGSTVIAAALEVLSLRTSNHESTP
jgi:ADP-heptose:LPS heptosyltransferase